MRSQDFTLPNCFIRFKADVSTIALPLKFTYPFNYTPHKLSEIASAELQEYLLHETTWEHDFGLNHYVEGTNVGKMFGVLVVKTKNEELGYLAAFSGKVGGSNNYANFVPPIFDALEENGFYRKGEDEIVAINKKVWHIESSPEYKVAIRNVQELKNQSEREIEQSKLEKKRSKEDRDNRRIQAFNEMSEEQFVQFDMELNNESKTIHYNHKKLLKEWREKLDAAEVELKIYTDAINHLKLTRRQMSANLQQRLFDQYQFLNIKGEVKSVCSIFEGTSEKTPPSGSGDCAAPKLLQYAFYHELIPIAMAEFWWGQSPNSEIRKHKQFYPSCRGKCEPILGHMLKGIDIDENPMIAKLHTEKNIEKVYEDEWILVVNKPADFLSVPGKQITDSVYERVRHEYPNATGPLVVHRLDMSTSGLLLIAKDKDTHKALQAQFLERTVEKRYVALLDGIIEEDEGIIDLPLRVDLDDRPRQLVCYEYGKRAITKWKVIERREKTTLVYFYPITGRTHQLRVHASHIKGLNTPIVGDDLYGERKNRLHLHAESLKIEHPKQKNTLHFLIECNF